MKAELKLLMRDIINEVVENWNIMKRMNEENNTIAKPNRIFDY